MSTQPCEYNPNSCQSLLGYGRPVHKRSGGICKYCNFGKDSVNFDAWRQLSVDHIIPARLFPGEGKTLSSIFPNLPNEELKTLAGLIDDINLVTACNFCNSMTSRMPNISVEEILVQDNFGEVFSVDDPNIQQMLNRLQERVNEVLPMKRKYVRERLKRLCKTFETDIRYELYEARKRPQGREVLYVIDDLMEKLKHVRAYFPHLDESLIGQFQYESPAFYELFGYEISFHFTDKLTRNDIERGNDIGHFINMSYIFMLYSVLERHHVIGGTISIDGEREGYDHIDLLRRLRNAIGHGAGKYNAKDKDDRKLYKRLREYYKLDVEGADLDDEACKADAFPLPIDRVLLPMTEGCRKYVEALLSNANPLPCILPAIPQLHP